MRSSNLIAFLPLAAAQCLEYSGYASQPHEPFSSGKYQLASQRPIASCRTYVVPEVEAAIANITKKITDPDLARLFENTFPNTLDTTVAWKGSAQGTDEELAFVITGDINAMWLRDSAYQIRAYLALLDSASSSLASLYRGVINLQARFIRAAPFCNAFQAPPESGLPRSGSSSARVHPSFPRDVVYDCTFELDSLTALLEISSEYHTATGDASFFGKYSWIAAVETILDAASQMMAGTYAADGSVLPSPYTYRQTTDSSTGTQPNNGMGNPVKGGTGLVRSAFRPSDDATTYQLNVPQNMQFSHFLSKASQIMAGLDDPRAANLTQQMSSMASTIRTGITKNAIIKSPDGSGKEIYAYEIDGYGGVVVMDDSNMPSLLGAPLIGYINASDPVYAATRPVLLSSENPYWMAGSAISGIGGAHAGPGRAWPMAAIVRALTSDDDEEIAEQIRMVLSTTNRLGLIHESIWTQNPTQYTRSWFAWANGLFGQLVVDTFLRKPHLLERSYQ